MRVAIILILVASLANGCLGIGCKNHNIRGDCSYGPGYMRASTSFSHDSWNATRLANAERALGFTLQPSAYTVVAGARGDIGLVLTWQENNSTHVEASFAPVGGSGIGYTQDEAQAILDRTRALAEPRLATLLSDFEAQTNLTHDSPVQWSQGLVVT